jgi:ribosomal protein S18 acetylase RimI-like enzyme
MKMALALDAAFREQVEVLFFFNPLQGKVLAAIERAIERFGIPRLEVNAWGQLVFTLGEEAVSGTLYLLDETTSTGTQPTVAAVALCQFVEPDTLAVVHLAVHPDFRQRPETALGDALLAHLRRLAAQTPRVRWLWLVYAGDRGARLRVA